MRRINLGVAIALCIAMIPTVSLVFADAIRSPNAHLVGTYTCDNGQTARIVSPSDSTPVGQVIGTNQVLVITQFTDVGTAGGVPYRSTATYAGGHGQANGLKAKTVSCSQAYEYEDPQVGSVTGTITVFGILTPHKR